MKHPGLLLSFVSVALLACSDEGSRPSPGKEGEGPGPTPELTAEEIERLAQSVGVPAPATEADAPVFAGLRTRDHELWIHNGPGGPLYTVKSPDGKVLASQIDDARLARLYTDLHALVHGAVDVDY